MRKTIQAAAFLLLFASLGFAQSALDGTSVQISTYNMPDSVGAVRLIDGTDSNCRVEGGPDGNDKPEEGACISIDSGLAAVTLTFNAGAQAVGDALVTPSVTPFEGVAAGTIDAFNFATDLTVDLDWSRPGDILEFTLRTADDSFPAADDEDFWGFSATGIQYPNAAPDSHVVLPFDEGPGGNYTNFYFWFEDKDGPITDGYEVGLEEALGVGRHPLDPNRQVVYPIYSTNQADEQTDTVAGGFLDFHSHGSILSPVQQIGNALVLAENTLNPDAIDDALESVTGVGFALLVQPPEIESTGVRGDYDDDGQLTANDIDLLSAQVGGADNAFDLNMDGSVTSADRDTWIELAGTLSGDTDLNGAVEFPDFLSLSSAFGKSGGWADGDSDGNGEIEFPDFLALSANFGKSAGVAQSVPEPAAGVLLALGFLATLSRRRSR